jgi:hypothetical protein
MGSVDYLEVSKSYKAVFLPLMSTAAQTILTRIVSEGYTLDALVNPASGAGPYVFGNYTSAPFKIDKAARLGSGAPTPVIGNTFTTEFNFQSWGWIDESVPTLEYASAALKLSTITPAGPQGSHAAGVLSASYAVGALSASHRFTYPWIDFTQQTWQNTFEGYYATSWGAIPDMRDILYTTQGKAEGDYVFVTLARSQECRFNGRINCPVVSS